MKPCKVMSNTENIKIAGFLEDIQFQSAEKFEILESIRSIFKAANPKLEEDIKYGGLVFNLSGTLLGGIFVYAQHVSIEFSFGAELADPNNILEGKGKYRRHIKIRNIEDISDKQATGFINSAMSESRE